MFTRKEQKDQTRLRILEAARDVFEEEGYEQASLRRIAKDAGVVAGTIFVHFKDKRDLLHTALFEDLQATLTDVLQTPPGSSLPKWLDRLTDRILNYYESRPVLSRVLLKESLLAEPPWAHRFAAQFAELHAGVEKRTRLAIEKQEYDTALNASVFAAAYISFYMFGLVAWAQDTHPAPRSLIKNLVSQHLGAYRKTKERSR